MTIVTSKTVTARHVKAARALLDWTAADLASECRVAVTTIRRFESGVNIRASSRQAIFDAVIEAGIEFQNGGKPGARLMGEK
ncbi:MAG: helix-turn-helix transcriptional regulator [Robiginitomaculum sp.]